MNIHIIGAGVAGLTTAVELAARGMRVEVFERAAGIGPHHCSWYAGGMLAPWCERESAEELIVTLGKESIRWWSQHVDVQHTGTLVVVQGRDAADLQRFAQLTSQHQRINGERIAELEPDLAGRFQQGLYFGDEAMLDPRVALQSLVEKLQALGGVIHFNHDTAVNELTRQGHGDYIIDCTGLAARGSLCADRSGKNFVRPELVEGHLSGKQGGSTGSPRTEPEVLTTLRGVKGEMLLLRTHDIKLHRPVRMLHPRIPVYIVPRANGIFMVGATMIESDDSKHISARSMLELLSAAYALHPAFGEAEIIEIGTQVRPAFTDNLPRIIKQDRVLYINGFYRHGYLVAPALAIRAADVVQKQAYFPEVMDEHPRQRQSA